MHPGQIGWDLLTTQTQMDPSENVTMRYDIAALPTPALEMGLSKTWTKFKEERSKNEENTYTHEQNMWMKVWAFHEAGAAGAVEIPEIRWDHRTEVCLHIFRALPGLRKRLRQTKHKPTSAGRAKLRVGRAVCNEASPNSGKDAKVCSLNPPEEPKVGKKKICVSWLEHEGGRKEEMYHENLHCSAQSLILHLQSLRSCFLPDQKHRNDPVCLLYVF